MAVLVLILLLEATRVTVLRVTKEITVKKVRVKEDKLYPFPGWISIGKF